MPRTLMLPSGCKCTLTLSQQKQVLTSRSQLANTSLPPVLWSCTLLFKCLCKHTITSATFNQDRFHDVRYCIILQKKQNDQHRGAGTSRWMPTWLFWIKIIKETIATLLPSYLRGKNSCFIIQLVLNLHISCTKVQELFTLIVLTIRLRRNLSIKHRTL